MLLQETVLVALFLLFMESNKTNEYKVVKFLVTGYSIDFESCEPFQLDSFMNIYHLLYFF